MHKISYISHVWYAMYTCCANKNDQVFKYVAKKTLDDDYACDNFTKILNPRISRGQLLKIQGRSTFYHLDQTNIFSYELRRLLLSLSKPNTSFLSQELYGEL